MTVNSIDSVAEFSTNGVTTNFPFFFKFLANEDLVVTYVDPAGVSTVLTYGTQYSVNGAGDEDGGSVVTTAALAGPGQLVVSREMDAYQLTSLRNQGKFLAETHEDVFDRLTMLLQQGLSIFRRALVRPPGRNYYDAEGRQIKFLGEPTSPLDAVTKQYADGLSQGNTSYTDSQILRTVRGPSGEALQPLPPAASRANKVMGFDSAGNPVSVVPGSGSAAELALDLANKTDPAKGAGYVGYKGRTVHERLSDLLSVRDGAAGAKGDGATNDTAAFTSFEVTTKGKLIDLGGRTFVVDVVPNGNAYHNGFFKVAGFTKAAVLAELFPVQPPHFHNNGGQLSALKASLASPFTQILGITFIGDSITWGSGNTGEQAPTDPRDGTLSDPRDYFGTSSFVNILKRYIGENYSFNAAPSVYNYAASSSGQSIVTYTKKHILFPHTGDFTTTQTGVSTSVTRVFTPASVTGCQLQMLDGNLAGTSSVSVAFPFTGDRFTLSFGVGGDASTNALDYEVFVGGASLGVFTTGAGEDGLTIGNDRRREHVFSYHRDTTITIITKRRAGQNTNTRVLRLEGIIIDKTVRISNQGINGASSLSYRLNCLAGNPSGDGVAVDGYDNFVFVQLGTNDRIRAANRPAGSNEFLANYSALIAALPANVQSILMCANPVANEDPVTYALNMQDVRSVIYRVARTLSLDMIDNYAALASVSTTAVTNDGLHPNQLGHALMARNIINAIEAA